MSCTHHLLNLQWEHHSWKRRVTETEHVATPESDMWGRPVTADAVRCHAEHVCTECGEIRDGGECLCDQERGEHCRPRLAFLEEQSTE